MLRLSETEQILVELIKEAGNIFYKSHDYCRAITAYEAGLAILDLDSPEAHHVSTEDIVPAIGFKASTTAAILYMNIAQAYQQLSKASSDNASCINPAAAGHAMALACIQAKRIISKMISVPDRLQAMGEAFAIDILAKLNKACIRQGLGAELAGNFPAVQLYFQHQGVHPKLLGDMTDEYRQKGRDARATLDAFVSARDSVTLPRQVLHYEPSPQYQYQASMQTTAPPTTPDKGACEEIFNCGHWKDMQFLVMRLKHNRAYTYAVFVQRRGQIMPVESFQGILVPLVRGATLNGKLYLMDDLGRFLVIRLQDNVKKPINDDAVLIDNHKLGSPAFCKPRCGCSLVAHGNHLYIFGGFSLLPSGKEMQASKELLRVNEVSESLPRTGSAMASYTVEPNHHSPVPRYGHVSWVLDDKMFVFGGIEIQHHPDEVMYEPLNDLWIFDFKTQFWTQLAPVGVPTPRAHIGMACLGRRVVLVGGQQGSQKAIQLSDIYEFDTDHCCFVQVLPAAGETTWMSGRKDPCCVLSTDSCLAVLGGFKQQRALTATNVFNIRRGKKVPQALKQACCREKKRDLALEKIVAARRLWLTTGLRSCEIWKRVVAAPPGALTLFTQEPKLLARVLPHPGAPCFSTDETCLFRLGLRWNVSGRPFPSLVGNPDLLGVRIDNGSGCLLTPFHVAPRPFGLPNEEIVHLAAASTPAQRPAQSYLSHLSFTMKCFSTVKGAMHYFHLTSPENSESFRGHLKGLLRLNMPLWALGSKVADLYGVDGYLFGNGQDASKEVQIYLTAVVGHTYFAVQATIAPGKACPSLNDQIESNVDDALHVVELFGKIISQSDLPMLLTCARCGLSELRVEGRKAGPLKVCKGCHAVRFCSAACQRIDWKNHKKWCKSASRCPECCKRPPGSSGDS